MVGAASLSGTRAAPARYAVRLRGRVLALTAAELVALPRALALERDLGIPLAARLGRQAESVSEEAGAA